MSVKFMSILACVAVTFAATGCTQTGRMPHHSVHSPKPLYRWEENLKQDVAACSIITQQLNGGVYDPNMQGFYENYYRCY